MMSSSSASTGPVQWNESLSVGISRIDLQHKNFIRLLNDLDESLSLGRSEALSDILWSLVDYAKIHFATEEELFLLHDYPESKEHIQDHEAFNRKVAQLQSKSGENINQIAAELLRFMREWLNNHVIQVDQKYSAFLISKGVS